MPKPCPTCGNPSRQHDLAATARHLDISMGTLKTHRFNLGTFPQPDGSMGRSPWWDGPTLDKWRVKHPTKKRGDDANE